MILIIVFLLLTFMPLEAVRGLPNPNRVPTSGRPGSLPFISGDSFRSFCDHILDETDVDFEPAKVKKGDTIFLNGDFLDIFFKNYFDQISSPFIIVSHNTDMSSPAAFAHYLESEKIIAWFGQNIDRKHPKMHGIPIGLANPHWPHGNIGIVMNTQKDMPSFENRMHKAYLNF